MIKIAILGSENSHCKAFASALAPKDGNKRFPDVELLGVFGEPNEPGVAEAHEAIAQETSCRVFASDKDAFLEEADAVMVTARDGANHLKYAENYIKKGIPVWIDKPTTRSIDDLHAMLDLAEKHGAVLSGGSSLEFHAAIKKFAKLAKDAQDDLRGGQVTAPVNMVNPYGDFWFYSQHLVAMMIGVFGTDVKSVRAVKTDRGVHALYAYDNFSVNAYFGTGYSVSVYTNDHHVESEGFDLPADIYLPELDTFYQVIKTGKPDKSKRDYIAPVYILDATIASFESGNEIAIDIPQISY